MKYDIKKTLAPFPHIREMLKRIPTELWDILLPDDQNALADFEISVLAQKKRETEREKVIAIQKACGFPLRPNQPLREVTIKARIRALHNNQARRWHNGEFSDMA